MNKTYTFADLVSIIEKLRGENGCPWDRVQTHESIKMNLVEEAYEAMEALDDGTKDQFADELGDVLLQVVFHSEMAEEEGNFSIQNVLNHICKKFLEQTRPIRPKKCWTPGKKISKRKKGKRAIPKAWKVFAVICRL